MTLEESRSDFQLKSIQDLPDLQRGQTRIATVHIDGAKPGLRGLAGAPGRSGALQGAQRDPGPSAVRKARRGRARNAAGAAALSQRTLARGKHSVSYRMRAEIPGKFSALPTRASAMYAPELKANSDEIKLRIED